MSIKVPLMKNAFLSERATKEALSRFILETDIFSMGNQCENFEIEFSNYQLRKTSTLFNSGGSANLALLQALKNLGRLKDGDKVGFSALTWSTNIMPIIQLNLVPVPIDCNVETLNVMSTNFLDTLKVHDLKMLFITNVLGFIGDLDNINNICSTKNIILCEDNCESLGTISRQNVRSGNFGLASTFSFFVAHHMSTIEGGMVCTDDEDLSEMLRIVRANGWDRNLNDFQKSKWRNKYHISSEFQAKYTFYDLGYNLRPTEITGFLGRFQLSFLNENVRIREGNYLHISKIMSENADFYLLNREHICHLSTFAIPIICKTLELKNKYIKRFIENGVEIRPMIAGNIQRQPFYSTYVSSIEDLPNTDLLHFNGFYCGNYPELSEKDLETISGCLYE